MGGAGLVCERGSVVELVEMQDEVEWRPGRLLIGPCPGPGAGPGVCEEGVMGAGELDGGFAPAMACECDCDWECEWGVEQRRDVGMGVCVMRRWEDVGVILR